MIITNKINMDLAFCAAESRGDLQTLQVYVVQDDKYSRDLEITLLSGGEAWAVPEGAAVAVSYVKPDGTVGKYDTLPDGTAAWFAAGNVLTVALAPQVLTCPGLVSMHVHISTGEAVLSTFEIQLVVQRNPAINAESEDYINMSGFLQIPGQVGQIIQVSAVDADGKVTAVEAVTGEAVRFTEQTLTDAQKAQARENIGAQIKGDHMPDYWTEYLEGKLPAIRSMAVSGGSSADAFIYFTDHHIGTKNYLDNANNTRHIIDFVRDHTPIHLAFHGGDIINTTSGQTYEEVMRWMWRFHDDYIRGRGVRPVLGNHEIMQYNTEGNHMTVEEAYSILFRDTEQTADTGQKLYYFVDNPSQKIRYIVLDSESETISGNTAQLQWFVNALASMGNGWTAVMFAHDFSDVTAYDNPVNPIITQIAGAYNSRKNGNSGEIAWDFSTAVGTVACLICGHRHLDGSGVNNGILVINVTTDCGANVDNASPDNVNGANRRAGDVSEQAVELFFINTAEKTVKTIRLGYGEDREWSYASGSQTVNLMENASVAVGAPGLITANVPNLSYYTEAAYSRATLNPLYFYAESGTLNVSLSDYSVYQFAAYCYSCDESAKDVDFSFTEGTVKYFEMNSSKVYDSGWKTADFSLEINGTCLIALMFRRQDDANLDSADTAQIKTLLTATVTSPTA